MKYEPKTYNSTRECRDNAISVTEAAIKITTKKIKKLKVALNEEEANLESNIEFLSGLNKFKNLEKSKE